MLSVGEVFIAPVAILSALFCIVSSFFLDVLVQLCGMLLLRILVWGL